MDGRDDRASMNRPSRMPQPALAQCVAAKCSSHVIADNAITHPSSRYRQSVPDRPGIHNASMHGVRHMRNVRFLIVPIRMRERETEPASFAHASTQPIAFLTGIATGA